MDGVKDTSPDTDTSTLRIEFTPAATDPRASHA
jgi:hypothetical protein